MQDQNLALQLDALKTAGCDKVFQEKVSGATAERPERRKLLELIREGDTLVIWKLDRLGRSLTNLIGLVTDLEQRHVGLLSLNDPVDTTTAQGRLIFRIFAGLAEFDRIAEATRSHPGTHPGGFGVGPWARSVAGTS